MAGLQRVRVRSSVGDRTRRGRRPVPRRRTLDRPRSTSGFRRRIRGAVAAWSPARSDRWSRYGRPTPY